MPHHHHPPGHVHHHRDHPRHPHALASLNSVFSEALGEHSFESIEDLRRLVERHQPKLGPQLEEIFSAGVNDPYVAVQLLQIDEAMESLGSFRELILLSSARKAAAILPLPPHIWHRLEPALHSDLILNSEDHLPPHLAREDYQDLRSLMPRDLAERVNQIEAVALEGFMDNNSLQIRRSAARFIQMINANRTLRLFVHPLPHRPHHAEFSSPEVDVECVFI